MMIGGALGAVSNISGASQPRAVMDPTAEIMNPMVAGQAMLPNRNLLENMSASPDHTMLAVAMKNSGVSDALKADGQFTVFAPTNVALPPQLLNRTKAQLARMMGYLVVPGKYDSQALLRVIGEGGGEARLRTVEGGVLLRRLRRSPAAAPGNHIFPAPPDIPSDAPIGPCCGSAIAAARPRS